MRTITVKLPDSLAARLTSLVKRRGRPQSEVVREALESHPALAAEAADGSCLDLARDLAGSLDGPPDLSSNSRHKRDYGR